MICPDREPFLAEPHALFQPEILKTYCEFRDLFGKASKQTATVSHDAGTIDKVLSMELTAMLLRTGFDGAIEHQQAIKSTIISVLELVQAAGDDSTQLAGAIKCLKGDGCDNIVNTHRTTAELAEPRLTRADADRILGNNYLSGMTSLESFCAKPRKVLLAIDGTSERCRSKYKNGLFTAVHIGSSAAWERGYKYSVVKDVTTDLFVGCIHRGSWLPDNDPRKLDAWIADVQACVARVRKTGSDVEGIEADRDYFSAEYFASATAGLLAIDNPSFVAPRVIAPRRFGSEKSKFIWDYLLEDKRGQVFIDNVRLNVGSVPVLKTTVPNMFKKREDGRYDIPYACIALIDEYRSTKERSLNQIRAQARNLAERMEVSSARLRITEKAYMAYNKRYNKQPVAVPSLGRGSKRKRFVDDVDEQLYKICMKLQKAQKATDQEKKRLLSSVVFFAVSLRPQEDPTKDPETFISIAKDYHSRWGIENGIKTIKHVFHRHVHGRRPAKRQLALILGMIVHNHWIVARKEQIAARLRTMNKPIAFTDPSRPWIRIKFEVEMHDLVPAVGFLSAVWKHVYTQTITNKLKGVL
jgi:hypothetical protein